MRVLLDNNVILDAMLQRVPWRQDADDILKAAALGQVACAVTTHSLATSFYVGRKTLGAAAARAAVRRNLTAFDILPIDRKTLVDADALTGSDFEDNILIAPAAIASLDVIVTRNVADFAHSPIPAMEPADVLKKLAGQNPPAAAPGPRSRRSPSRGSRSRPGRRPP